MGSRLVEEIAQLTAENAELRSALVRCQRQLVSLKARSDALLSAVLEAAKTAALAVELPPKPALPAKRNAETALLHVTDWQLGKKTETYDVEVCKRRVMSAVAQTENIVNLRRESVPVRDVVLLLGGDMVEGLNIFPGQAFEVEQTLFTQLFEAAGLIAAVVSELAGSFNRVVVVEEFGNHGRLGKRGDYPPNDNVDLMAYRIAETMLANTKGRVTWQRATTWHQIVEIGAYRALLVHGDEIRSYGGNHPVYGIVRKVAAWQSGVIPGGFQDCYLGHFHRPDTYTLPSGGSVYLTGSPESGNEYAREFLASTGRPSQRLHLVDPAQGRVTVEHRLWLD